MIFSAALHPCFHSLLFLLVSQQYELLEALVNAAESIGCSTAGASNESSDAAQSISGATIKEAKCTGLSTW